MRILHLTPDEKFFSTTKRIYDAAFPNENKYIVLSKNNSQDRFIAPSDNVLHVEKQYWFSNALKHEVQNCDCLIIHFMNPWFAQAIKHANHKTLVVWSGWGGDYYDYMEWYKDNLLLPETKEMLWQSNKSGYGGFIKRTKRKLLDNCKAIVNYNWRNTFSRVDIISIYPNELKFLQAGIPQLSAEFHQLYYFSVEDVFEKGPLTMDGPNILIGNSANPTNNHIELFNLLKKLDLDGRILITPLSYGNERYADMIERRGRQMFGEKFLPLRNYMPIDEYNKFIQSCGFVFMNHVRQQAIGNVTTALYKGAKVFLRKENLVNAFYRDLDIVHFDMPESGNVGQDIFNRLPDIDRENNRRLLYAHWNFDRLVEKTKMLNEYYSKKQRVYES